MREVNFIRLPVEQNITLREQLPDVFCNPENWEAELMRFNTCPDQFSESEKTGISNLRDAITNYIFPIYPSLQPCTPESPAFGLVFGCTDYAPSVHNAVEQYNKGNLSHIILSGGTNPKNQIQETEEMHSLARSMDIPDEIIFLDSNATNTRENVLHSYELILKHFPGTENYSVVGFPRDYHGPRCRDTMSAVYPMHVSKTIIPSDFAGRHWFTSKDGIKCVVSEAIKANEYFSIKSHIALTSSRVEIDDNCPEKFIKLYTS